MTAKRLEVQLLSQQLLRPADGRQLALKPADTPTSRRQLCGLRGGDTGPHPTVHEILVVPGLDRLGRNAELRRNLRDGPSRFHQIQQLAPERRRILRRRDDFRSVGVPESQTIRPQEARRRPPTHERTERCQSRDARGGSPSGCGAQQPCCIRIRSTSSSTRPHGHCPTMRRPASERRRTLCEIGDMSRGHREDPWAAIPSSAKRQARSPIGRSDTGTNQ